MFNMESRHLLNLSVQNALDCISQNFNLKNFPGGACARDSLEKCAVCSPDGRYLAYIATVYNCILYLYNLVPRAFPLKNGWGGKSPGDEVDISRPPLSQNPPSTPVVGVSHVEIYATGSQKSKSGVCYRRDTNLFGIISSKKP